MAELTCEICGKKFERDFGGGNLTDGLAFKCPQCAAQSLESTPNPRPQSDPANTEFASQVKQIAPANPVITWILVAVNLAAFAIELAKGAGFLDMSPDLAIRLGANYGPMTLGGQWWRLLTSMFLHFGIFHIFMNMLFLFILGSLAERLMGRFAFLVLYFGSGLAASLASLLVHPQLVAAGASGAVFGICGGLVSYLWLQKAPVDFAMARKEMSSLGIFIVYNLLYSFRPGVDYMAHIGGLVSGFAIAAALPRFLDSPSTQAIPSPIREVGSKNKRITEVGIVCAILILVGALGVRRLQGDTALVNSTLDQIDSGHAAGVIPTLEQIVKRRPGMAMAHFALGSAYLNLNRAADSVRELSAAINLQPGNAAMQHQLGAAYLGQDDYDNAIPRFRQALSIDPDRGLSHFGLAIALFNKRQFQEAADEAREAVKALPTKAVAHSVLGQAEIRLGNSDEGIKELETAMRLDPTDEDIRTTLVNAYMAAGKFDKANTLKSQPGK